MQNKLVYLPVSREVEIDAEQHATAGTETTSDATREAKRSKPLSSKSFTQAPRIGQCFASLYR